MKIAFVVNNIYTEWPGYTTTQLACVAHSMGHEVWYVSVNDFAFDPDERVHAFAYSSLGADDSDRSRFLEYIRSPESKKQYIDFESLDVVMLRNDPAEDARERPWARLAGINFARLAEHRGLIVLNDPDGLSRAINKLYLHYFPIEIRPQTLITRDRDQIKSFVAQYGSIVIKPLFGSGGRNVFLVRPEDGPNINQMIDAVSRDGYVIAQEYLPEAINGDVRVFLINGEILRSGDKIAAFRRVRAGNDMRSNMTAGATSAAYQPDEGVFELVEKVSGQIKKDGLFLVGLDVVGTKIMEINVFSPGGLNSAERFTGGQFAKAIIGDIEKKVRYRHAHPQIDNKEIATLSVY